MNQKQKVMSDIKLTINNKQYSAIPGETIYELCTRNGIEIPTLCHDSRLEPYSSCYLCVVEVENMRGLQTSCSTKVAANMIIHTDTERVRKSRKMALELILSNHYADCMAPCRQACPAGVDVQGYISLIDKKMYTAAVALIKETNPLPAICGRVCVRPCEAACRRNLLGEGNGVGVDYLKRFVADYDLQNTELSFRPKIENLTGKKIAVVGGGPGGLSVAYFLQIKGHQVDIFDANPQPGGMLRYGIPSYRLPNEVIDAEIKYITDLGVRIFSGRKLGDNLSYEEINRNYDATILTIGSQNGTLIGCDGDDAQNVFSGIDFLRNMEATGSRPDFSKKRVAVVGGGNTAMDCSRTAVRCGAEKVYIIYRRTENEMPANPIEIHESKIEGVEYLFLTNPTKINKDEKGVLKSITCIRMQLGEEDASGRRRPEPVAGSEFELELDYVLAAIGQKTNVDFIEDINKYAVGGQLKITKRGDVDANRKTLQTGIPSVFAAGDGVTGPATIIEAIAQAKIAAVSCHQYLTQQDIVPEEKEFLSRKENFKDQVAVDYQDRYVTQTRHEMPVLDADKRKNFEEVELGYADENVAVTEAQRCLECGCVAYYDCKLKEYATQYGVDQRRYAGEYKTSSVDFSHPFIEIDTNKCILCARCVRICHEVVGANALGLVKRGFDTYVSAGLGGILLNSSCESCGMCIETCPTGAITENVPFKPGPLKLQSFETISNYGSEGIRIKVHHTKGFVMKVTGAQGLVNKDAAIGRVEKFGYHYFNDTSRILTPLLRVNDSFCPISFGEAFEIISERIISVVPDENMFFAGARLTNQEQYLVQKLARGAAKTNNILSFFYMHRGDGYRFNCEANTPFEQIKLASKIYIFSSELHEDNPVVWYSINSAKVTKHVPVELFTIYPEGTLFEKVTKTSLIESYYYFIKAINHYIVKNNLYNGLFINDICVGFDDYKKQVLAEDYTSLIESAGVDDVAVSSFVKEYIYNNNALIIFSEKEISSAESVELYNLAMLTGKLNKTGSGIISLKEKNNAQGLFDMGCSPAYGLGSQSVADDDFISKMEQKWGVTNISRRVVDNCLCAFDSGIIKNAFIFGEDPVGCSLVREEVDGLFDNVEFLMVQDYFMTDTARQADLILPASFPTETGGCFTNSWKMIQPFDAEMPAKIEKNNIQQLIEIINLFDINRLVDSEDVMSEIISLLPEKTDNHKFVFEYTSEDDFNRIFDFGCDNVMKKIDDFFESAFSRS